MLQCGFSTWGPMECLSMPASLQIIPLQDRAWATVWPEELPAPLPSPGLMSYSCLHYTQQLLMNAAKEVFLLLPVFKSIVGGCRGDSGKNSKRGLRMLHVQQLLGHDSPPQHLLSRMWSSCFQAAAQSTSKACLAWAHIHLHLTSLRTESNTSIIQRNTLSFSRPATRFLVSKSFAFTYFIYINWHKSC